MGPPQHYAEKVRQTVNVIDRKFPSRKQFTAKQLSSELGFNGTSIARMYVRRGFPEPTATAWLPEGPSRPVRKSSMKSVPEFVSSLQYAQEVLDPVLASLHQQDCSELFFSVCPGLAQKVCTLLEAALHQALQQGWYAGRRGHVSKLLVDALGNLQQATHAADSDKATHHMSLATECLGHALTDCHRIGRRHRRAF